MELRHLTLDVTERRATARVGDFTGERELTLVAERCQELLALAPPGAHRVTVDALAERAEVDGAPVPFADLVPLLRQAGGLFAKPRPTLGVGASDVAFWETLYNEGADGWELTRAAPPLVRWFEAHSPAGRRALVVGAGRGHEARLLARLGAEVVAVDFSPRAILQAEALAESEGVKVDFQVADLFSLGERPGRYQLFVEHCCFCAIEPHRREEYVEVASRVLVEGGALVGLFRTAGPAMGPPWGVSENELGALFAARFELTHFERPSDSVPQRRGQELLARFQKR